MRIARSSLHEEVLEHIRTMVIQRRWPAGTRFPEVEVCEELGVSRTPLREALKVLATEGLVELQANRGAVIRVFTPKETYDTLMLMGELEAYAGQLAVENMTDEQLAEVTELHEKMLQYHAGNQRKAYFATNRKIHEKIVEYADNSALLEVHRLLRAKMLRILYAGSDQDEFQQAAVEEHERIYRALISRDGDALVHMLREHQLSTWQRVRDSIEEESQKRTEP